MEVTARMKALFSGTIQVVKPREGSVGVYGVPVACDFRA